MEMKARYNLVKSILAFLHCDRHTLIQEICSSLSILLSSHGLAGNFQYIAIPEQKVLILYHGPLLNAICQQPEGWFSLLLSPSDKKLSQQYCYCLCKLIFHQSQNFGGNRFQFFSQEMNLSDDINTFDSEKKNFIIVENMSHFQ